MSIAPGYTNDQIREFVYEYDRQPHGTKATWLAGTEVSRGVLWKVSSFEDNQDA